MCVRVNIGHRYTHIPSKWPADFYFVNVRRRELDENHNKNKCINTIVRENIRRRGRRRNECGEFILRKTKSL